MKLNNCTLVNNKTGEILDNNYTYTTQTLQDIMAKNTGIQYRKSTEEFRQYINKELGNFYFNFYKRFKKTIPKQYIFRFIYLCCYMDYNNRIVFGNAKEENRFAREKDLQEILMLQKTEFFKTKNIFLDNKLIEIDNYGIIVINKKFCQRGNVKKNKRIEMVRMFEDGIKDIYKKADVREHKKLATLILLLPYVNFKYNIVCKYPLAEDIKLIDPLSLKQICDLLEYSNVTQLTKDLLCLTVGGQSVFVLARMKGIKFIAVNPKIYYKGNRIEDLKWLVNIFKMAN